MGWKKYDASCNANDRKMIVMVVMPYMSFQEYSLLAEPSSVKSGLTANCTTLIFFELRKATEELPFVWKNIYGVMPWTLNLKKEGLTWDPTQLILYFTKMMMMMIMMYYEDPSFFVRKTVYGFTPWTYFITACFVLA